MAMSKAVTKGTTKRSAGKRAGEVAKVAAKGGVTISKTVVKGADVWRIERPHGVEIAVTSARVKKTISASAKRFHRALASLATK